MTGAMALWPRSFAFAKEGCQPVHTNRACGVYLRASAPTYEGKFKFTEKFDQRTYERWDFVERPSDNQPVLFYHHGRSIAPTMGHQGRFVLINDYSATKACEVVIADLESHKKWNIDTQAVQMYQSNAKPDGGLIIIPEAYGLSPDDQEVLIGMDLIYVSVPTGELEGELHKTYKRWWYVVDSSGGRVLHEYRITQPPPCWWVK